MHTIEFTRKRERRAGAKVGKRRRHSTFPPFRVESEIGGKVDCPTLSVGGLRRGREFAPDLDELWTEVFVQRVGHGFLNLQHIVPPRHLGFTTPTQISSCDTALVAISTISSRE